MFQISSFWAYGRDPAAEGPLFPKQETCPREGLPHGPAASPSTSLCGPGRSLPENTTEGGGPLRGMGKAAAQVPGPREKPTPGDTGKSWKPRSTGPTAGSLGRRAGLSFSLKAAGVMLEHADLFRVYHTKSRAGLDSSSFENEVLNLYGNSYTVPTRRGSFFKSHLFS